MFLDMYDDGGELLKQADWSSPESAPLLDALESVISVDKRNRSAFPDEEFALVMKTASGDVERYFPIGDPGNISMSLLYFWENAGQLEEGVRKSVAGRLAKAASRIDLWKEASTELQKYADAPGEAPQDSLDPSSGVRFRNGVFPTDTTEQRRTLSRALGDLSYKMDPMEKRACALQCTFQGVALQEPLMKYASFLENPNFRETISQRANYLGQRGFGTDVLDRLANICQEDDLEKRASRLCRFDSEFGPFRRVPDGVLSVFAEDPFVTPPAVLPPENPVSGEQLQKLAGICDPALLQRVTSHGLLSLDAEEQEFVRDFLGL